MQAEPLRIWSEERKTVLLADRVVTMTARPGAVALYPQVAAGQRCCSGTGWCAPEPWGVRLLARAGADILGLIGSGNMAAGYLRAIGSDRALRRVLVYSPDRDRRRRFAQDSARSMADRITALLGGTWSPSWTRRGARSRPRSGGAAAPGRLGTGSG